MHQTEGLLARRWDVIGDIEVLEDGKGTCRVRLCRRLGSAPTIPLVEVGPTGGTQALAVGSAEDDEGGLHEKRARERVREVDRIVIEDEREVHIVLVIALVLLGRGLVQVVLVDLAGHVEARSLEAAVAGALHVGREQARDQDPLTGVGEHEVIVDAGGEGEVMLPQRVALLGDVSLARDGVASVGKAIVYVDDDGIHVSYQAAALVSAEEEEFSTRV